MSGTVFEKRIIMVDDQGGSRLLGRYVEKLTSMGYAIGPGIPLKKGKALSESNIFCTVNSAIKYLDLLFEYSNDKNAKLALLKKKDLSEIVAFIIDMRMPVSDELLRRYPDFLKRNDETGQYLVEHLCRQTFYREASNPNQPLFFVLSQYDRTAIANGVPVDFYSKTPRVGERVDPRNTNCESMHEKIAKNLKTE